MACQFNKKHHDCLYWIYPLVILLLIIFASLNDQQKQSPDAYTGADNKVLPPDINLKASITDSLKTIKSSDTLAVFYATK